MWFEHGIVQQLAQWTPCEFFYVFLWRIPAQSAWLLILTMRCYSLIYDAMYETVKNTLFGNK